MGDIAGCRSGDFYYLPGKREPWTRIPSNTLILAHHGWHCTAAARRDGTIGQAGGQTAARATAPAMRAAQAADGTIGHMLYKGHSRAG